MKKLIVILMAMVGMSALFAQNKKVGSTGAGSGKTLVVYFSWSGNLDKMAHWVAEETGGDLIRVTAKEAYPSDYNKTAERAKGEKDKGTRPAINVNLTKEQMAQYDTVYFGFPV